jgi:gamma-glutamyltranspeptidase/glutathione hydrolase
VIPDSGKDSSVVGYKSIGVPGSVAGLVYAEKKYGKLSLGKIIAPAIKLARDGFPLAYEDTQDLKKDEYLAQFPESKRIFLRDGNYYQPGELLKQPELAHTLERIAKNPDEFYHGASPRTGCGRHKGGACQRGSRRWSQTRSRSRLYHSTTSSALRLHLPAELRSSVLNILDFDLAKFGSRSADAVHPKPKRSAAPSTTAPISWVIPTSPKFLSRSSSIKSTLPPGVTPSTSTMPA